MKSHALLALLALASLFGACRSETPATALAIKVVHQFDDELVAIQYDVYEQGADLRKKATVEERAQRARGELDRPYVVRKGDADELWIVVTGLAANDRKLAVSRFYAKFEREKTLGIGVVLAKVCRDRLCEEPIEGQPASCSPVDSVGHAAGTCAPIAPATIYTVDAAGEIVWDASLPPSVTVPDGGRPDGRAPEMDARVDGSSGRADGGIDGEVFVDDADGPDCVVTGDGGACNVITQCGCEKQEKAHCQLVGGRGQCTPFGAAGVNQRCVPPASCAAGLACVEGVCRAYCDGKCPGGECVPIDPAVADIKACVAECDPAQPLCGDIQCVVRKDGKALCLDPKVACSSKNNGTCDEPRRGNGTCALGTDTMDCCDLRFGDCELGEDSCGCATTTGDVCQLNNLDLSMAQALCRHLGAAKPRGARCQAADECAAGLGCIDQICSQFCETADDCTGGGACVGGTPGRPKYCRYGCDFNAPPAMDNCEADTVCARVYGGTFCFAQRQGPACTLPPATSACDESTRICAPGSDPNCMTTPRPMR